MAGSREGSADPDKLPAKRQKKAPRKDYDDMVVSSEYVLVKPVSKRAMKLGQKKEWRPVQLCSVDKAPEVKLSAERLAMTSWKGYRMASAVLLSARATHGAKEGTWYFEVTVSHLGATGHARIGWSTRSGELQACVGYDRHSYGYRDLEGCKVHQALREPYGEPYSEGDVIGCLLHLPPGGRSFEKDLQQDGVIWKGKLHYVEEGEPPAGALPGSYVAFYKNGTFQGTAYSDILEGTYYPAASVYTLPQQREGATLAFNLGPDFKHPPLVFEGSHLSTEPKACSVLAGKPDAGGGSGEEGSK